MTALSCVAKLPGLMQPGPPQFIDPRLLADRESDISGDLAISKMRRLHDLLHKKTGSVEFELHFGRDEQGRIRISGQYSTCLCMQCQRCLQPLQIAIAHAVDVALVSDEHAAAMLPRTVEPLILTTRELSLSMFIEDELLLGLPLAPSHGTTLCHRQETQYGEEKAGRQLPFAALKDLQLKKK